MNALTVPAVSTTLVGLGVQTICTPPVPHKGGEGLFKVEL